VDKRMMCSITLNSMVILRAMSILGGQKEDKGMMCSIISRKYSEKTKKKEKKKKKKNIVPILPLGKPLPQCPLAAGFCSDDDSRRS
jgi:exopolyphosphatase/pppGpp-phosphohydrolase